MVRIRFKRMGRRHHPFYRLNAIDKRSPRDGKIIESLGWYDPMAKDKDKQIKLDEERIRFWLDRGAQGSETVNDILAREGIIDAEAWKAKREARVAKRKQKIIEQKRTEDEAKRAEEAAAKKAAEEEAAAAAESEPAAEEGAAAEES